MVQLQIKNLHNDTFSVECDENDTIKALKANIAAKTDLREKYDPELLKLLYTGKVMDDDETVKSFSIKPDGYLVLVKQTPGKPKPPPKKKTNAQGFNNNMGMNGFRFPNAFSQNPFQQNSFMQNPFQQNSFMQQPFQQNSFTQQPFQQNSFTQQPYQQQSFEEGGFEHQTQFPAAAGGGGSGMAETTPESFSTAEDREEALQTMIAMGFERSKSEKALRASFYNVETAIEYITSGSIPPVDDTPAISHGTGPTTPTSQLNPSNTRRQGAGGMGANLQQMRQILQQNPEQLQVIKQSLQNEHPEIAKMIDENPQAFLELLKQAGGDDDEPTPVGTGGTGGLGAASGTGSTGGASGPGQGGVKVTLSPQEQQTINRLQDMGFDRNRALEAFLTCERNEELAINYLLNAFD